jgi:hypothetical protein
MGGPVQRDEYHRGAGREVGEGTGFLEEGPRGHIDGGIEDLRRVAITEEAEGALEGQSRELCGDRVREGEGARLF